jgi:hypothetical protein
MRTYIEVCVQTHPVEDKYFTSYRNYIFMTDKNYSHKELVDIMKNTNQKYTTDRDWDCQEIDFTDLSHKLAKYEIYQVIPFERYYFDLEEQDY